MNRIRLVMESGRVAPAAFHVVGDSKLGSRRKPAASLHPSRRFSTGIQPFSVECFCFLLKKLGEVLQFTATRIQAVILDRADFETHRNTAVQRRRSSAHRLKKSLDFTTRFHYNNKK